MLTFMIDKILNYKTYTDRMKIDALLEIDCNNYANLGSDSTKTEKLEVKKQRDKIKGNNSSFFIHRFSSCHILLSTFLALPPIITFANLA